MQQTISDEDYKFDEIGYWSEIKLDIIREYASAYSRIMSAQHKPAFSHIYIDAFAGGGKHKSKETGKFILGSPANALLVEPSFKEYHLIDLDSRKAESLEHLAGERNDVHVYNGDCNDILLQSVFPRVKWENYKRALCILDPYGLHLDWKVIETAGKMKSIEIFLNFPIADMNRNVLWKNKKSVSDKQAERLTRYWGDESWENAAYKPSPQLNLFGEPDIIKETNKGISEAFRKRLKDVAGFSNVPEPVPMKNRQGAIIYFLFFASQKPVAQEIVKDIFKKYSEY